MTHFFHDLTDHISVTVAEIPIVSFEFGPARIVIITYVNIRILCIYIYRHILIIVTIGITLNKLKGSNDCYYARKHLILLMFHYKNY